MSDSVPVLGRFDVIDWITISTPVESFPVECWETLLSQNDRIARFDPQTGDVRYEIAAWDSIRSDSHSISACVSASMGVRVQGSPARIIADGDSVFSSGASAAEDLTGCVERMISFYLGNLGIAYRPPLSVWKVTRIDVTRNLKLDSLAEVRQGLTWLRNAEGGRYRVNQMAGDTVYWNKTSQYKKAKAYAKGPHLLFQGKQKGHKGREYSQAEIELASHLLRLELTLFRRYWEKNLHLKDWREITPELLNAEWHKYFDALIGQTVMNDEQLKNNIFAVAKTPGQGKAAYLMWYSIKAMGWELAKENQTPSTWYRNLGILKNAGLKVTDIGNGKIIPFRVQKLVTGLQVNSWSELRKAA